MSNHKAQPPIPAALLDLMKVEWRDEMMGTEWDDLWSDRPDRRRDPSGYIVRASDNEPNGALTHGEVTALLNDGLLRGMVGASGQDALWVNEHAAHAIQDFGSSVYASWRLLRKRLALAAEQHTPREPK